MKKIVFFGNCQAGTLKKIMSELIESNDFILLYYSNNPRTGGQASLEETLDAIESADFLIYQPLGNAHGELAEEKILQRVKDTCILLSFVYIFNSGIYSLCNAPATHKIFGSEKIIELLNKKNKVGILQAFKEGKIDFDLPNRFNTCLAEMKKREEKTVLQLADYISENYRDTKLFITHNHPTNALLFELIRQIKQITNLPIKTNFKDVKVKELPNTNCPISPYDIAVHGYKFEADKNWFEKASVLIRKIIKAQQLEMQNSNVLKHPEIKPLELPSTLLEIPKTLPDVEPLELPNIDNMSSVYEQPRFWAKIRNALLSVFKP